MKTMKRLLVTLTAIFAMIFTTQAEHLSYMGIPIDGNFETMKAQLEQKGFIYDPGTAFSTSNTESFKGTYQGYPATVLVVFSDKTKNVYGISVLLVAKNNINTEYEDICKHINNTYKIGYFEEEDLGFTYYILGSEGRIIGNIEVLKEDDLIAIIYTDEENENKYY